MCALVAPLISWPLVVLALASSPRPVVERGGRAQLSEAATIARPAEQPSMSSKDAFSQEDAESMVMMTTRADALEQEQRRAMRRVRPMDAFRQIKHNEFLPPVATSLIRSELRHILLFVMTYLEQTPGLEQVSMYTTGGFVRDLLLGRGSDDLDLTLDLRSCPPGMTIDSVVEGMPAFAERLCAVDSVIGASCAVASAEIVTAMSATSRSKAVDAAQVSMTMASGEALTVDLMPTIAAEMYDAHDRIPRREGRGTALQDSLRRDLTANSIFLEIVRDPLSLLAADADGGLLLAEPTETEPTETEPTGDMPRSGLAAVQRQRGTLAAGPLAGSRSLGANLASILQLQLQTAASPPAAVFPTPGLRFRLLDFHSGLDDLRAGVLRAPYDPDAQAEAVWAALNLTDAERDTFFDALCGQSEADLQVLWWVKSLRDDPLRLVRTLRFAATLQFRVHGSFWRAVPLCCAALRTKVSGPRKTAELRKIAKAGLPPLLDFFEIAFAGNAGLRTADGGSVAFGDSLFGGPPLEGEQLEESLSVTNGFTPEAMREMARALPAGLGADAQLGAVLTAAVVACDLRANGPCTARFGDADLQALGLGESALEAACVLAGPPCYEGHCEDDEMSDEQMGACLDISRAEVERACAGLQASTQTTQAAVGSLRVASSLLGTPRPLGHHALFAAAGGFGEDFAPADAADFAATLRMWELFKLDPAQARRRLEVGSSFVLALLRTRCAPSTVRRLEERVRLLSAAGPSLRGQAIAEVEGVPPHLRGQLMAMLHVLCRVRGEAPELHTAEQVSAYLEVKCGGLLTRLRAEWWDEATGEPRPEYTKHAIASWLHESQ